MTSDMDTDSSGAPFPDGKLPPGNGILPSQALTRFEPPEGFVAVTLESATKQLRYGFRAAGLNLVIRQGVGSEAVPMMPLAVIPNSAPWMLGVINLRGNLVPVCDLRYFAGYRSDAPLEKPMILVLDKGDKTAGFLIEGYPIALNTLHQAKPLTGLPEAIERHVKAMITPDDEVWLEFNHESLLEEAALS